MPYSDKPCAVCGALFTPRSGRSRYCVTCRPAAWRAVGVASNATRRAANPAEERAKNAAWRAANPDKVRAQNAAWRAAHPDRVRADHLRIAYGITIDDYEAMLQSQQGVCAICGRPPQTRRLHVDHDHVTLRIRGLLCDSCNRRIVGRVRHGDVLRRAAHYLDEPPAISVIGDRQVPPRKPKRRKTKATEGTTT